MKEKKIFKGTVTEISIKNRELTDKWQNVFKLENLPFNFVYWHRANINLGDTVAVLGFETPTAFVCQKLQIHKLATGERENDT